MAKKESEVAAYNAAGNTLIMDTCAACREREKIERKRMSEGKLKVEGKTEENT